MGNLNCRSGDLAVMVRSELGQQGVILRCVRRLRSDDVIDGIQVEFAETSAWWVVDRLLLIGRRDGARFSARICPDRVLRPIRDQPGDDETLLWAGLPNYHESPVALALQVLGLTE